MGKIIIHPSITTKKKRGITLKRAGDVRRALTSVFNDYNNGEIDEDAAKTKVYILQAVMKSIEQSAFENALDDVREGKYEQ